jgi:hypothetical protein
MNAAMSLRCLVAIHRPYLGSIARKANFYVALCEGCGRPLERGEQGKWAPSRPLGRAA